GGGAEGLLEAAEVAEAARQADARAPVADVEDRRAARLQHLLLSHKTAVQVEDPHAHVGASLAGDGATAFLPALIPAPRQGSNGRREGGRGCLVGEAASFAGGRGEAGSFAYEVGRGAGMPVEWACVRQAVSRRSRRASRPTTGGCSDATGSLG